MSSIYATQLADALPDDVPAAVAAAARGSLGAGDRCSFGPAIGDAAREAFVHAMSRASIVAAVVAAFGAFIAWRYLPARETDASAERSPDGLGERELATAGAGPGNFNCVNEGSPGRTRKRPGVRP